MRTGKKKDIYKKKGQNSRVAKSLHFIRLQNYFYFDANLLNLQMWPIFKILHMYMCSVCSPLVLEALTQSRYRMIWETV